jgi:hypothetical protein
MGTGMPSDAPRRARRVRQRIEEARRRASRPEIMGAAWIAIGLLMLVVSWLTGLTLVAIGGITWAAGRYERRRK